MLTANAQDILWFHVYKLAEFNQSHSYLHHTVLKKIGNVRKA